MGFLFIYKHKFFKKKRKTICEYPRCSGTLISQVSLKMWSLFDNTLILNWFPRCRRSRSRLLERMWRLVSRLASWMSFMYKWCAILFLCSVSAACRRKRLWRLVSLQCSWDDVSAVGAIYSVFNGIICPAVQLIVRFWPVFYYVISYWLALILVSTFSCTVYGFLTELVSSRITG